MTTTDTAEIPVADLPGPVDPGGFFAAALGKVPMHTTPAQAAADHLDESGYVLVHKSTLVALSKAWGEMPYGGSVTARGPVPTIVGRRRPAEWEDPRFLLGRLRGLAEVLTFVSKTNAAVEREAEQTRADLAAVRRVFGPLAVDRARIAAILAGASCSITEDTDPGILDEIVEALG